MPKLGSYKALLDAVFFLYASEEAARAGENSGGTGFLIGVPSKRWPEHFFHVHGVSNWHVAVRDGFPCPRINMASGGPAEAFEFDCAEWIFEPGGPDIAISPPIKVNPGHKYAVIDAKSWLVSPEEETSLDLGPGEDVFMVGRFVDHDGVEENAPALRFGHVSITNAKITQSTGYSGRSIVLDMHSRTGFSGSPVFVYRTLGAHFLENAPKGAFLTGGGHYLKCLGIHWGQFPEIWELKNKTKPDLKSQSSLITEGAYVEGLSGMTCIVPAAHILKLLYSPELQQMREMQEIERERLAGGKNTGPKSESAGLKSEGASPPATDENPTHREDFTRLVGAAARKREQED